MATASSSFTTAQEQEDQLKKLELLTTNIDNQLSTFLRRADTPKKWEYYGEAFQLGKVELGKLNLLGASGWELVGVTPCNEPGKPVALLFVFKREN